MIKDSRYSDVFFNRELSWLEFNKRVLEEAQDVENPLLERVKFLSIFASNLDEFFMVRVASVNAQYKSGLEEKDIAGMTPKEQIDAILEKVRVLVKEQQDTFNNLQKLLYEHNIKLEKYRNLNADSKNYLDEYYKSEIYPVLTPMVIDQARPFPLLLNKTLNIAVLLKDKATANEVFATIQVPSVLSRLISIPSEDGLKSVLLEDIIKSKLSELFSNHEVLFNCCYRITKNADLSVDEDEAVDLLETIEESLKQRKWGEAIRLEIENCSCMNKEKEEYCLKILEKLVDELELPKEHVFYIRGVLDYTFLSQLGSIDGFEELKYRKMKSNYMKNLNKQNIFDLIKEKDILLHNPFQSFDPIVNMVRQAADDPNVLAIKQTLYRVSGNSPIIEALTRAAENGKQVTVLVELKARFDEENNINWAKKLEKAGCHVIYGVIGLKTHCKILLVVRKEKNKIKRYVHFGTGNYNDVTARFYTDIGILTANEAFGEDASKLFNMLSGYSSPKEMEKITIAPFDLRNKFEDMIKREAENAKQGKKARIIAKMNSLVDRSIINELYKASNAGVEIELIVRGICCLMPGVKGLSENIKVRSIVGRLLEHSRIYYFYNDSQEEIYIASGDWMHRNLNKRVETMGIVEDESIREKIKQMLDIYLRDNTKSRLLNSDGSYTKNVTSEDRVDSQTLLYKVMKYDNKVCESPILRPIFK